MTKVTISTKGLNKKILQVFAHLSKTHPSKGFTSNDITTEILRHNPGTPNAHCKPISVDVSKRLSHMAIKGCIKRTSSNNGYLYYPSTVTTYGTAIANEVTTNIDLNAKDSPLKITNPSVTAIKDMLNVLTASQLNEVIVAASLMLSKQAEANAHVLRNGIERLLRSA